MHAFRVLSAVLFLAGGACAKKAPPAATATPVPDSAPAAAPATSGQATPANEVVFRRVHFALDRSDLSPEATAILAEGAKALLANPALRLRVEGHADERGGTQYNLALSLRRAEAIRRYLVELGVERSRIDVVAFGSERPLVQGHDEAAWSKNRRGEMAVTEPTR